MHMLNVEAAREEIPVLLEELREANPRGYEWVADVYSEVIKGLRRSEVRDPTMVGWLYESIAYHMAAARRTVP